MQIHRIAALVLLLGTTGAMAECEKPETPELPDGATSSMDDMLTGQKAVKSFQAANIAYLGCLEAAFSAAEAAAKEGSEEERAAAAEIYSTSVDAYNAAVAEEEALAGQFNTEIREYKAANPG